MSLDLKDIKRLKITPETAAWLESECRDDPSRSKQEILRDVLHEIAVKALRKASLLVALSPGGGHSGDSRGHGGKR